MITNATAFVFPGQGSQTPGMGRELSSEFAAAREIYTQADNILDFPISRLSWEGPEKELNDTYNTQPALLVHSIATWRVLQELFSDIKPVFLAGHSMGELSALVVGGSLLFREALELTRTRGWLMKKASETNPGGMAAIIGLDIATLEEICTKASSPTVSVQIANDNCPGQVVISGATIALERALEMAKDAGARRIVKLAVSIASHSPLMSDAQKKFALAVHSASIKDPIIPIIGNVTASPLTTAESIRAELCAQLTHRVRWTESIRWMISKGVTTFIELGTGTVLAGLIKRIDQQVNTFSIGKPEDFDQLL